MLLSLKRCGSLGFRGFGQQHSSSADSMDAPSPWTLNPAPKKPHTTQWTLGSLYSDPEKRPDFRELAT